MHCECLRFQADCRYLTDLLLDEQALQGGILDFITESGPRSHPCN